MPWLENSTRGFYGASVALNLTNCQDEKMYNKFILFIHLELFAYSDQLSAHSVNNNHYIPTKMHILAETDVPIIVVSLENLLF